MNLPLLASGDPFQHTWNTWNLDVYFMQFDLRHIPGFELLGLSNYVLMMLVAAGLILLIGMKVGADARTAVAEGRCPRGMTGVMEVFVQFFRDEVIKGSMPHHWKSTFLNSIFLTFFFFILFCNLLGLLPPPFGHTATGSPWVTGALAFLGTFMFMKVLGSQEKGVVGYWTGLVPHGVPWWLWPMLFVIEVIGTLVKPFALMIRLAANMTAGHIILAVLLGFLTVSMSKLGFAAAVVYPASAAGFAAITIFEIVIAFIQAYIFTHLSAVFVGLSLSHDH